MRRAARGQAVVEAVLGTLVFVTILIFGIHFAELGALTLKVQEAANSAVWDTTSQKMHDITGHDFTDYRRAINFGEAQASSRYADFDALKSSRRTSVTQVFTHAENLQVPCRPLAGGDGLDPSGPAALAAGAYPGFEQGLACTARAELTALRIPSVFLDGSLSEARHHRSLTIPACAIGRPDRGRCPGRLGMLLDDWGYMGQQEARECPLAWEGGAGCSNQGYYDQVASVYAATPAAKAGSASRLATVVSGGSPIDEDFFFMSFRGSESPYGKFKETVRSSHGDVIWETTPYAHPKTDRYDARPHTNCFLGIACR